MSSSRTARGRLSLVIQRRLRRPGGGTVGWPGLGSRCYLRLDHDVGALAVCQVHNRFVGLAAGDVDHLVTPMSPAAANRSFIGSTAMIL